MKITSIQTALLQAPLSNPFKTALRRVDTLEDVIVIITCDDGSTGYGEGAPTPAITGETIGSLQGAIAQITPMLIGKSFESLEYLLDIISHAMIANTTAKAALEMAIYDLVAKKARLPLYKFLGGEKTTFKSDITISLNDTKTMVEDSLNAVSKGYEILKVKLGNNEAIETIQEIHQTLENKATLRLDANQAWTPNQTISIMQKLESMGIFPECIEQPINAYDLEGLKYIKNNIATPLLADEAVFSPDDARKILEYDMADYINIKLAKCGGISKALQIADIARKYDAKCMIGCMLEGPIAIAAALHVASVASDVISMIDLDAVSLLASLPCNTSLGLQGNILKLSTSIGIGVTPKYLA